MYLWPSSSSYTPFATEYSCHIDRMYAILRKRGGGDPHRGHRERSYKRERETEEVGWKREADMRRRGWWAEGNSEKEIAVCVCVQTPLLLNNSRVTLSAHPPSKGKSLWLPTLMPTLAGGKQRLNPDLCVKLFWYKGMCVSGLSCPLLLTFYSLFSVPPLSCLVRRDSIVTGGVGKNCAYSAIRQDESVECTFTMWRKVSRAKFLLMFLSVMW